MEEKELYQGIALPEGMSIDEMIPLFFDGALIESPYRVYQLNTKGHRYYYHYNEEGEPQFYPSVTTMLSQVMPTSPFLMKWVADMGYDEAERYKLERASYGTFMHAQFESLIIDKCYDLDGLKGNLRDYIEQEHLPSDFINYADDFKKDILSFAQFIIDYEVKPIAVEIALVHPVYRYAGMIDLVCSMKKSVNSDERINAIVDFKSGRKQFYEEHEIQLHLYKSMWNENFPKIQVDKVFNFSPKDWRKKPTYNFKDQTESINAKKIPALLELASIEDMKLDNTFTHISGIVNLNTKSIEENMRNMTLSEIIKTKK